MKISSLFTATQILDRVREKKDAEGNSRNQHQQNLQQQQKDQDSSKEGVPDEEVVGAAVQAFGSDTQNQTSGISASMTGNGPGLRVVLKDGTGAVIRQFTGEEFLKLREAASQDGRVRGKILDQKF